LTTKAEVKFAPRFLRGIRALDREAQARVLQGINVLKDNPRSGKPLRGEWQGVYSLRIGDYRVLYQIRGSDIILLVIGHRKHIYE